MSAAHASGVILPCDDGSYVLRLTNDDRVVVSVLRDATESDSPENPTILGMVSDRRHGGVQIFELRTIADFDAFMKLAFETLSGTPLRPARG